MTDLATGAEPATHELRQKLIITSATASSPISPVSALVEPAVAASAAPAAVRRPRIRARGIVGLALVSVVVLLGLLAPLLAPYDPLAQITGANLLTPSTTHPLGTDHVNRDIWSRLLFGIRTDLVILALGVPIGALIGTLSALLGTLHPAIDLALQRMFDVLLSFPTLILAIGLVAVLGSGIPAVVAVIAIVETPVFGRMIRSRILTVTALPYVDAAVAMGAGRGWILAKHVLPNSTAPLGVQLALSFSLAVFVEGAMSFLGIGVRPPQPSLGNLISDGIRYADSNAAYVVGPLLVVVALALGLQLVAQAFVRSSERPR